MKLIYGLQNLKPYLNSAITIGNFDGVHLGHQKIILRLIEKSKKIGAPSVLISFSPTPQSFFNHKQASLSSFKEKHALLSALGLDVHLIIRFNQDFSQLEAQDFVQEILLNKLGMKYCLIGDDFRFGKGRQGDFSLLQTLSKIKGFTVEKTLSIYHNTTRISSSAIRSLLAQDQLQSAAAMLGRAFSITGTIAHGLKKGRSIDFPTINIPIKRKVSPIHGIFAVIVELDGDIYQGVCSIGNRPIIGGTKTLLEVFLFNFNREVYGLQAKTFFKYKIRKERDFANFSALKKQIEQDVEDAKKYFN